MSLLCLRKKRGKKDKTGSSDRKTRASSTAEFDFSEESIGQLALQFGISETKIRQMGTHSGKIEAAATAAARCGNRTSSPMLYGFCTHQKLQEVINRCTRRPNFQGFALE